MGLNVTFDGELWDESSVGDDDPVAEPCPPSADPSLLDLESAIFVLGWNKLNSNHTSEWFFNNFIRYCKFIFEFIQVCYADKTS